MNGPKRGIQHLIPMPNSLGGHAVPQLGFGTRGLPASKAEEVIRVALEAGFRHFDCAKGFCNQKAVGAGLKKAMRSSGVPREALFITSKLWPTDQHPQHVRQACEETLAELGVGYLDTFLVHWPVCWRHSARFATEDDIYPREDAGGGAAVQEGVTLLDTWRAMCALVKSGLVRDIGVCNCRPHHIEEIVQGCGDAEEEGGLPLPVMNQIEFHPACQESELVKLHKAHGMLTAAHSPLGVPPPPTTTTTTPPGLLEDAVLKSLSDLTGYSVARLLLNWNLDQNNVVLSQSSHTAHIQSNAKAAQFALSDPVRLLLNSFHEKVRSCRVVNPSHFLKEGGRNFFPTPAPSQPTAPFGPYRQ